VAVPCQSAKVDWTKWRDAVFAGAFVSLAASGHARLARGTRSGMLGIRRHATVLVEPLTGAGSLSGLEGTILAYASQPRGPKSVYDIVDRLRNEDSFLPITKELIARGYGAEKGTLAQLVGERWTPDCQRIRTLEGQVQPVKDMIQSFRQANSAVYDLMIQEIRATYS